MTKQNALYISLMVIKLGGRFSNAYGLCRFINLNFGIYDCLSTTKDLVDYAFVTFDIVEGVEVFRVSENGEEVLKENRQGLIEMFHQEFPDQVYLLKTITPAGSDVSNRQFPDDANSQGD